jgi:phosphoenolpyruvate carboxylase
MSQSTKLAAVSEELADSVECDQQLMPEVVERHRDDDPNEIYRRKLLLVAERLGRTLENSGAQAPTLACRTSWMTFASSTEAWRATGTRGSPRGVFET